MVPIASALIAASILSAYAAAQATTAQLVGTWTTKSRRVLTGAGFYDPTAEIFHEPALTGISYSFSADGHYEEAWYRAIPNPTEPSCPSAMMQWQHGSYIMNADSSMLLTPISSDGRQLYSDPCSSKTTTLVRFDQVETFAKVNVSLDIFNNQMRMELYGYDGMPQKPMWQKSTTPIMLPVCTLTPTSTQPVDQARPTGGLNSKSKRMAGLEDGQDIMETADEPRKRTSITTMHRILWLGLSMTGVGSILVFCC